MKKWFFQILIISFGLSSCLKSDEPKCTYTDSPAMATAAEIAYIQNYLSVNAITAVQHPSGIFYTIDIPGTGANATVCSNVTVNYTGSLMATGEIFDSNTLPAGISFTLGQLIVGWQKGIPLIKSGGAINLYIPPSLGYGSVPRYGNNGQIIIPADSYIAFGISLKDVQ